MDLFITNTLRGAKRYAQVADAELIKRQLSANIAVQLMMVSLLIKARRVIITRVPRLDLYRLAWS